MQRTPRVRTRPKKDYTTPDVIREVREHPILWDTKYPGYHNSSLREAAWHTISSRFYDCSAKKAFKVWQNARKALRNQINRIKENEKSGDSAKKSKKGPKPYKHTKLMSFLKGNDTTEKQLSNFDEYDNIGGDCEISSLGSGSENNSDDKDDDEDEEDEDTCDDEDDEEDGEGDEEEDADTENRPPESAIEHSVRQQLKPQKRKILNPLQLNFLTEKVKKLAKDTKIEAAENLTNSDEDIIEDIIEDAKKLKAEKKLKAKQERQRLLHAKSEDRLARIREKVAARGKISPPPINEKKTEKGKNKDPQTTQTMEVLIREEAQSKEDAITLFCLSIAGRLNALPAKLANSLTLPILQIVVQAESEPIQSSSLNSSSGGSVFDHYADETFQNEEERVVQKVLNMPEGAVAVSGLGYTLKGCDMQTLKPLTWLNDQVINMYLKLIEKRSECEDDLCSVKVFSTFLFPTLVDGLDRGIVNSDKVGADLIFIPIHHKHGHWALVSVDTRSTSITLYDSLGGTTEKALEVIEHIKKFLATVIPKFEDQEWYRIHETDGPQQLNGKDCGVFICMYAEYVARGVIPSFKQDDVPALRDKMIYEIMSQRIKRITFNGV